MLCKGKKASSLNLISSKKQDQSDVGSRCCFNALKIFHQLYCTDSTNWAWSCGPTNAAGIAVCILKALLRLVSISDIDTHKCRAQSINSANLTSSCNNTLIDYTQQGSCHTNLSTMKPPRSLITRKWSHSRIQTWLLSLHFLQLVTASFGPFPIISRHFPYQFNELKWLKPYIHQHHSNCNLVWIFLLICQLALPRTWHKIQKLM